MAPAAADDDGTYCLADLLTAWGADDALVRGVAPCWRARVVKHAESEEEALERVAAGEPVTISDRFAQRAFAECGPCALDLLCGEEDDALGPKVAFRSGWGAPGTTAFGSEEYLQMVVSDSGHWDAFRRWPAD